MKAKKYFRNIFFVLLGLAIIPSHGGAQFTEPEMIDYTNYPLFVQTATVKPNITIVLDNGQNMSEPAYGSFPGNGLIVPENYHGGDSYMGIRRVIPLNSSNDAGTVLYKSSTYSSTSLTLNLGYDLNESQTNLVGIRFDNIEIPKGRTISNAWIEFMPAEDTTVADTKVQIGIRGQAADDPGTFTGWSDLISRDTMTTSSATWEPGPWETDNPDNATTTNLKAIVQELVNRDGWTSGNAMVFLFGGLGGKRVAHAWDSAEGFSICSTDRCNKRTGLTGGSAPVLHIEFVPTDADQTRYYGIFSKGDWNDADVFEPVYYKYSSSEFIRCDKSGVSCTDDEKWHGNFLNWLTLRKIDIGMTALMGGYGASRTTNNTHTARGKSDNSFVDFTFYKWHDSTGEDRVSRYHGKYLYKVENAAFSVYDEYGRPVETGIQVVVDVDKDLDTERILDIQTDLNGDGDTDDAGEEYSTLNGIFESVGSKANWAFAQFNRYDGGDMSQTFAEWSDINANWLTDMQNFQMTDMAPSLAEMHYLITHYHMQDNSIASYENYKPGTIFGSNYDPYNFTGEELECPKSFVLYISTGGSENDDALPNDMIDYDEDGVDDGTNNQSFDDLALYARTNDLRNNLSGEQNLITYVVYAFGNDDADRKLLMNAAKQGGFDERGGKENFPDQQNEWDKNNDNIPDTYFEASSGDDLQSKILKALNDILNRAASGTAVAVLATRGEGEGTITQASFKPKVYTADGEINWVGFLQLLWIDSFGNIREDSVADKKLDIYADKVVRFFLDTDTGKNSLSRYTPTQDDPYPPDNATWTTEDIESLSPLWEASEILSKMPSGNRDIFTNITDNQTLDFTLANAGTLKPYLGVEDDATWGIAAGLGATEDNRVNNIIHFVRGADESNYDGSPSIRLKKDDDGDILKLGDIVNSTPVTASSPVENYGTIYNDTTYWTYYNKYINRETVVYVGANDGMLHAFTAGKHDPAQQKFETVGGTQIGRELWAYIPRSLLPHLKWLPQEGYTHVSYVDLDVRLTDAKIFAADDTHPEGWGSILLGGLNLGGKDISTQNAGDFKPSVFAIDVTDPRNPELMWEKSFEIAESDPDNETDLGLSTNFPAIIRVGGEWKLVYASGPTDFTYDQATGELTVFSDQKAGVYIVNMKTGEIERDYTVTGVDFNGVDFGDSYLGSPAAFDKELNYNVDSIFMGCTYNNNNSGAIFKITVRQTGAVFDPMAEDSAYENDPADWSDIKLFALAPAPVTGSFNMSIDLFDNVWLYGGTGRYMDQTDKTDTAQNYLFGIKDPFFNKINKTKYNTDGGGYLNYADEASVAAISIYPADEQLFEADPYVVTRLSGGTITGGIAGISTWANLLYEARKDIYDGWYRSLCPGSITDEGVCSDSGPSERFIKEPSILSGIVLFPTFSPNSDLCGFGANGRLWALYYETGTAFRQYVFGDSDQDPIQDVMYLGSGISSSFGLHIGRQEGGTIFTQMSTGIILDLDINVKLHTIQPTYWKNYVE